MGGLVTTTSTVDTNASATAAPISEDTATGDTAYTATRSATTSPFPNPTDRSNSATSVAVPEGVWSAEAGAFIIDSIEDTAEVARQAPTSSPPASASDEPAVESRIITPEVADRQDAAEVDPEQAITTMPTATLAEAVPVDHRTLIRFNWGFLQVLKEAPCRVNWSDYMVTYAETVGQVIPTAIAATQAAGAPSASSTSSSVASPAVGQGLNLNNMRLFNGSFVTHLKDQGLKRDMTPDARFYMESVGNVNPDTPATTGAARSPASSSSSSLSANPSSSALTAGPAGRQVVVSIGGKVQRRYGFPRYRHTPEKEAARVAKNKRNRERQVRKEQEDAKRRMFEYVHAESDKAKAARKRAEFIEENGYTPEDQEEMDKQNAYDHRLTAEPEGRTKNCAEECRLTKACGSSE